MMTESQAFEVWCPMSRNEDSDRCISSDCAAWRWAHGKTNGDPKPEELARRSWHPEKSGVLQLQSKPKMVPEDAQFVEHHPEFGGPMWMESDAGHEKRIADRQAARKGFCGLAGVPIRQS